MRRFEDKDSHIYYNLSYLNNKSSPQPILITENRNDPIINNPKKYHMTVARFTIATQYIPIFIFETAGNNLPNNNYYSVTINNSTEYITYIPANNLTSADDEYLFVYSYQAFLDMINESFRLAFIAAAPAGCTQPPYLIYEKDVQLFCLIVEKAYVVNNHKIYMNTPLYSFFDNFNVKLWGYNLVTQKDVEIRLANTGHNTVDLNASGYPLVVGGAYEMCQEYNSVYNWNDAKSIVFLSNNIAVSPEAVTARNTSTMIQGDLYQKMLTDIEFEPVAGNTASSSLRGYLQYIPMQYRFLDLTDDQPLYRVDLQVMFQTRNLRLYPLKLLPGEFLSMKIMFVKK